MDAGRFDQHISVLTLTEGEAEWVWIEKRKTWAKAEEGKGKNLFSTVGLGATAVRFTIRRQGLCLHDAIRWRGRHCFVTKIQDNGRLYLDVECALVEPVKCVANAHKTPQGKGFPGVLTEKFLRYEQPEPMAQNIICYVLVTPKTVELTAGGLVEVAGEPYKVLVSHTLDLFKNEYEIMRTIDL